MSTLRDQEGLTGYPRVDIPEQRPRTRGECVDGPRPCPWVGCRHHLYLEVQPSTGRIILPWGNLDPNEIPETCSLDVADDGEHSLEEVAPLLNLGAAGVHAIERDASPRFAQAFERMVEVRREIRYCVCGCGRPLPAKRRKYATPFCRRKK